MSGPVHKRALYWRRRTAGLCVACGASAVGARCDGCRATWRSYKGAYVARCVARGECHQCGYALERCECRAVARV
jgi:hypothetical protein